MYTEQPIEGSSAANTKVMIDKLFKMDRDQTHGKEIIDTSTNQYHTIDHSNINMKRPFAVISPKYE